MRGELAKQIEGEMLIYEKNENELILTYYLPIDSAYLEFVLNYIEKKLNMNYVKLKNDGNIDKNYIEFSLDLTSTKIIEGWLYDVISNKIEIYDFLDLIYKFKTLMETLNICPQKALELSNVLKIVENGLPYEKALKLVKPSLINEDDVLDCPLYIKSIIKSRSRKETFLFLE